MATPSRGVRVRSAARSAVRHPFAGPVGGAVLAAALLSGVALVAAHDADRTVRSAAEERVRSSRDSAVRALVRITDARKSVAATWAQSAPVINSLRSPSPSSVLAAQDQLSALTRGTDSPAVLVSDTGGRVVALYPAEPARLGMDLSFRDWFEGASRTGKPYVSDGYQSVVAGHPSVVGVAAPVLDGRRRVGYLTVLWGLDSVRSVIDGSRRDDGVTLTVTDRSGQPLTGTLEVDDRGEPLPVPIADLTRQALAGHRASGVHQMTLEADGPVPGLGWTVTSALPVSVALTSSRSFNKSLALTAGAALLLLVLFTVLAGRVALRRAAEQRLASDERHRLHISEERFRRVFDEGLTGKLLVNDAGDIVRANASVSRLIGSEQRELVGRPLTSLVDDLADRLRIQEMVQAGEGELNAEMTMSAADGRSLSVLVALVWLAEHDGRGVLLVQVEDITARRDAERRLIELALHDELTGLPNRRLLLERCEHAFAVARSGRAGSSSVAALFIDLDGFKPVNDRAGHETGDQVLIAVANDLRAALRPTETIARVGGDEFVVLLEQDSGLEYLRIVADRVTSIVRRQQVINAGVSLPISASVGIARVDLAVEPTATADQLLRQADTAMYYAKERGRDRHEVFDAALRERTDSGQELAQAIHDGLRFDRIALVYQPVVDVDSNTVVGAEALLRLTDSQGRLMPTLPAVVAAEAAGLADVLADRVLELALDAARTWPQHLTLAVNISARELTGEHLRGRIEDALERHHFDPARLILEITESSILSAGKSAFTELEKLRQRGIRIAIDDFGTAYATLANLTTLPVDALKVDTSFTAGLPEKRTHTAIVHGIASMALELNIPCIVEGIETDVQLAAIRGMKVQAQGWLWGKPLGPELVPAIIRA